MAKTWRSRADISTLTDLAYRRRALKPLVIDTALPYWQRATIKRAITYLRGLIKHPKPGLPLAKRIDSLAQELDYLQELAAARNAHRHRLGQRGFRGNVNHLNLLLASLDSPISENEWNHWRQSRPRIVPDLRGAHLEKLDPIDTSLYPRHRPGVSLTVENLEVAHFLSLVRSKPDRLADIINTASRHIVLLLGRFTGPGADVLALLRDALPPAGYAPIVFDFAVPDDRDLVETVAALAGLARFVIADLSQPRSTLLSLCLSHRQFLAVICDERRAVSQIVRPRHRKLEGGAKWHGQGARIEVLRYH